MDLSEEYILMCEKAQEIQNLKIYKDDNCVNKWNLI